MTLKPAYRVFLLSLAFTTVTLTSLIAAEFPSRTNRYVNDLSGLLQPDDLRAIQTKLNSLYNDDEIEVTVLTIRAFKDYADSGQSFENYATQLFNHWAIGHSTTNKGVLLLICKDDRKLRIELGRGYSQTYDQRAKRIIDDTIVPAFKQGRFSDGIRKGVDKIESMVTSSISISKGISWLVGILAAGALSLYSLFYFLFRKPKCRKCSEKMVKKTNHSKRVELMSEGEKVEVKLGSASFKLFFCNDCSSYEIKRVGSLFSSYKACTKCHYRTMKNYTTTLTRATETIRGSEKVTSICDFCRYTHSYTRSTPKLSSSSSNSGFSIGGGGGSSGGGGGSSSGGGASGSW